MTEAVIEAESGTVSAVDVSQRSGRIGSLLMGHCALAIGVNRIMYIRETYRLIMSSHSVVDMLLRELMVHCRCSVAAVTCLKV